MDIILELGGNPARLHSVIELAKQYPEAKIVISSEGSPDYVVNFLDQSSIPRNCFILDFYAWDTVTNFTETYDLLCSYNPERIYVVTDKFHMKRSMAIAQAVYFLREIELIPVAYMGSEPHDPEPESLVRSDRIRAWLWRLLGILKYYPNVKKERMPQLIVDKKHSIKQGYPVNP